MKPIRIGIVEDENIDQVFLKDTIQEYPNFLNLDFIVDSYEQLKIQLTQYNPDIILLDVKLHPHQPKQGRDIALYLHEINKKRQRQGEETIKIIIISTLNDFAVKQAFQSIGVNAFLCKKGISQDLILRAIKKVAICEDNFVEVASSIATPAEPIFQGSIYIYDIKITETRQKILYHISMPPGCTLNEISEKLGIGIPSLNANIAWLKEMFGVETQSALVYKLLQGGLKF